MRVRNSPKDVLSALAPAIQWAARENADALTAKLLLEGAKANVEVDQYDVAADLLNQMNRVARGSDLAKTSMGIDFNYLSAIIAFQTGDRNRGVGELAAGIKNWGKLSKRVYQVNLTDQLVTAPPCRLGKPI